MPRSLFRLSKRRKNLRFYACNVFTANLQRTCFGQQKACQAVESSRLSLNEKVTSRFVCVIYVGHLLRKTSLTLPLLAGGKTSISHHKKDIHSSTNVSQSGDLYAQGLFEAVR